MKNPGRLERFSRWGLLAVPIVLGLVLIATSLYNHANAKSLVDDLIRGQAEGFARDVREASRPDEGPPGREQLERTLEQRRSWGLRYLALVRPDGAVEAEAGERLGDGSPPLPRPGTIQRAGGRVRWLIPPPPRPGGPGRPAGSAGPPPFPPPGAMPHEGAAWPPPPGALPPFPPGEGGHLLLVEFEPLPALDMLERAERNVALNVIAALVLMAVTTILWRLYGRAHQAESDLARQQHLAVLGEMSAVLAHEIRNPLATVKGHAQLIAERVGDDDPQQKRWATMMVDHVVRLERLVNQLLDFSRTREVNRQPVSPATLLDEAGCLLDRDRIDLDGSDAPETWNLDAERMDQVFVNVLQNALQASPKDAQVDVRVAEEGGALVVTIRDRGDGIPSGQEHRIFEPFHTKRIRGTGLGLTVAKRIVELHGGTIGASNHPGGGAVFRITLPKG